MSRGYTILHLVANNPHFLPHPGPAIVEEASATTIVDEGGTVEVDAYGSLVIAVELEEAP